MKEFEKLISEVTDNYTPQYDYSKLEDKDLLIIYCVFTVQACQCVVRILNKKSQIPLTKDEDRKISQISRNPNPENLATLYEIFPDERPLKFLVRLPIEQRHILDELDRRHRPFKAGRAFILMDEGQPVDLKDIHKVLDVEKITSYRPEKEDAEDLKSETVMGAVRFFNRRGESVGVKQRPGMPIPGIPSKWGLPTTDPDPWGLWYRYSLDCYVEKILKDYLSLFFGRVDRLKEAGRQHLRDHFEKWKADKRAGDEVSIDEADKAFSGRSRSGVWRNKSDTVVEEEKADISQRMFEVLREAKKHKRWGPQFIEFTKHYLEGKSEKEAAKLAKITDRTARNHLAKLRKIFTSSK